MSRKTRKRKGNTIIYLVIFIAVALLVFFMIGSGFSGTYSGTMGRFEKMLGNIFGSSGSGQNDFKLVIEADSKRNSRTIDKVEVYSNQETIFEDDVPQKTTRVDRVKGDLYQVDIIYKNDLEQTVRASTEEFNLSEAEKVEFVGEVEENPKDIESREGEFFVTAGEVEDRKITVELPPYRTGEIEQDIGGENSKLEYIKENTKIPHGEIKIDPNNKEGMPLMMLAELQGTVCFLESAIAFDRAFLIVNSTSGDKNIKFDSRDPANSFYTGTCNYKTTCHTPPDIHSIPKKDFGKVSDIPGEEHSFCESASGDKQYFGWTLKSRKDQFILEEDIEINFTIHNTLANPGIYVKRSTKCNELGSYTPLCQELGKIKREPGESDDGIWWPGPYTFEYKYRNVCPAGYAIAENDQGTGYMCVENEKWYREKQKED